MQVKATNKSKIVVVLLVGIIVVWVVAPLFSRGHRIKAHVEAQLARSVSPTRMNQGREERLQRVVVTDCKRSLAGDKYAVQFELQYTGTLRVASGCVLARDEWGHWSGVWNPLDHPPVRIYIE